MQPTLNFQPGNLCSLPIIFNETYKLHIDELVTENISISKTDWDSFETSWDFKTHPFLSEEVFDSQFGEAKGTQEYNDIYRNIVNHYNSWDWFTDDNFLQLKSNEEELNDIFIDIYGLQDELTPEVEDKDVTIRKADLVRDVKNFISYAVGCMFGRYSIYKDGLILQVASLVMSG